MFFFNNKNQQDNQSQQHQEQGNLDPASVAIAGNNASHHHQNPVADTDLLLSSLSHQQQNPIEASLVNSNLFATPAPVPSLPPAMTMGLQHQNVTNQIQQQSVPPQNAQTAAPIFQMPPPSQLIHKLSTLPTSEELQQVSDTQHVHTTSTTLPNGETQLQYKVGSVDEIVSIPADDSRGSSPGSPSEDHAANRTAAVTSSSTEDRNRNWRLIHYGHHSNLDPELRVEINLSIRGEDAKCFVPDRLYCSHRYKVQHNIISDTLSHSVPILLSRLHIIDPTTKDPILSKKTGKEIVKGDYESACTSSDKGFECKMRIQFTESCYRYNRQDFQLIIHYCDPKNKEDPLFSVISPPLKIYARKPSTPITTLSKEYKPNKKRKRKSPSTAKRKKKAKSISSSGGAKVSSVGDTPKKKRQIKSSGQVAEWITPVTQQSDESSSLIENEETATGSTESPDDQEPQLVEQFSNTLQHLLQLQEGMNGEHQSRIQDYVLTRLLREAPEQLLSQEDSRPQERQEELMCS
mmetsp:Transcript_11195/g.41911  ORF Transcript_11195/g.41911 Transcript_11195/m.41911 type:complete len:519 (-) Transcript_11195:1254-2810(-)|eukprot:CAMPEP_0117449258 /NCGR_PEP_ID=MMETSP0759-20121206/7851_1 /TAXON_ID=63605 /ORGANISM="Percolomonas cosmopolitus, Strain WS" /LENGTH=518 /DNA_ID=CAMNT_0005241725 /DNA_START=336 /DNA_END=1892 /DNA_ORIENTATION=-